MERDTLHCFAVSAQAHFNRTCRATLAEQPARYASTHPPRCADACLASVISHLELNGVFSRNKCISAVRDICLCLLHYVSVVAWMLGIWLMLVDGGLCSCRFKGEGSSWQERAVSSPQSM